MYSRGMGGKGCGKRFMDIWTQAFEPRPFGPSYLDPSNLDPDKLDPSIWTQLPFGPSYFDLGTIGPSYFDPGTIGPSYHLNSLYQSIELAVTTTAKTKRDFQLCKNEKFGFVYFYILRYKETH